MLSTPFEFQIVFAPKPLHRTESTTLVLLLQTFPRTAVIHTASGRVATRDVLWACSLGVGLGESEPQMHISKEGDEYLRTLLVQGAHYILGPFGETVTRVAGGKSSRREEGKPPRNGRVAGSTEAGGTAAPAVGEWRGVRTIAQ